MLTTGDHFFHLIGGFFSALRGDVVIDFEDHFFVRMAHPHHRLFHVHPGLPEHGTIGVAEVVRANVERFPGREIDLGGFGFLAFAPKLFSFGNSTLVFPGFSIPALLFHVIDSALNLIDV